MRSESKMMIEYDRPEENSLGSKTTEMHLIGCDDEAVCLAPVGIESSAKSCGDALRDVISRTLPSTQAGYRAEMVVATDGGTKVTCRFVLEK